MLTLDEIRSQVKRLAAIIDAKPSNLPTYGRTEDLARPHIEVDAENYHYVVVERGIEWSRYTTTELDDLLYQIFDHVTHTLAFDYELVNRIKGRDGRRIALPRQIHLLAKLSPVWADRQAAEHQLILQKNPFDDSLHQTDHQ